MSFKTQFNTFPRWRPTLIGLNMFVVLLLRIYLEKKIPGGYFSRRYNPIIHESDLESALVDKTKQMARGQGGKEAVNTAAPWRGCTYPVRGRTFLDLFLETTLSSICLFLWLMDPLLKAKTTLAEIDSLVLNNFIF